MEAEADENLNLVAEGEEDKNKDAARPSVAGWIDPDLLAIKFQDCICPLCFGVMKVPSSGCLEGHSCCQACYKKALRRKK